MIIAAVAAVGRRNCNCLVVVLLLVMLLQIIIIQLISKNHEKTHHQEIRWELLNLGKK